jgi:FtsP/CotA-like multicopper oxidase with cupredoxin domain
MHLHGFHFRTLARGDGASETVFPASAVQDAVTELVEPGHTIRIAWTPTRPGNWLMHCHLRDHVTPAEPRKPEERVHDLHDVEQHALTAMAGLILGITVAENRGVLQEPGSQHRLRLIAREELLPGSDVVRRGFIVEGGPQPPQDHPTVPGPPLVLFRDRTTSIEVVNEMSEATTVHWHGMELESVYDGVAGWSRTGLRVAPLVGPDSSFRVQMTPPRAGTFIYHTHMDETEQLIGGLYGPLVVLEPGESYDPQLDRIFVIGGAVAGTEYSSATINGQREPEPQAARAGMRYRLRFINITPDATVQLQLVQEGALQRWTPIANDGADLPDALRVEQPARLRFSAGQTYDFEWTPSSPGDVALRLEWQFPTEPGSVTLIQAIAVHDQGHPGRHGPAPPDAPGARLREGARGQAEPD